MEDRRGEAVRSPMFAVRKSGRGQPHSKTLRKHPGCVARASVLECGCPLPLSLEPLSADRTLQSHPPCTVELRFETFGNFVAACEQFRLLQCGETQSKKTESLMAEFFAVSAT